MSVCHMNNSNANIPPKNKAGCCGHKSNNEGSHQHGIKRKIDWVFWISVLVSIGGYILFILLRKELNLLPKIHLTLATNYKLLNDMAIGVVIGVIAIYVLDFIPKPLINKAFGNKPGISGILRAVLIGILFDMCSHGVLLIASKLYRQGVGLPQIIAFLTATPWNSISLTIIMITLIGLPFTIIFIVLSLAIAIISALIIQILINKGYLPKNPNTFFGSMPADNEEKAVPFKQKITSKQYLIANFKSTLSDSKIVIKWLLVGSIIASLIGGFISQDIFKTYLGPTIIGLFITLIFATIIEICSQGTLPIASEIVNRAHAPGNAFAFLMMGVPSNYSQIMVLKNMTGSWKVPLILFPIMLPQIVILGYLLNLFGI